MKRLRYMICAAALTPLLIGCGGSGSATRAGSLMLSVKWPERSRLIPAASNSIRATVTSGATQLGTQLLPRPEGNQSSVTFTNLPAGPVTLTATAFPNADGTGVSQATGAVPATIVGGQTAAVTVTMASTIDHVTIAPSNPTINVGASQQMTMTAFDAQNNVVLTSPSKVTWLSGTPSKATVNATGNVAGVAAGSSLITVTETESGKNTNTTVTVTAGGGGGGSLSGKIVFLGNDGIYYMNPDGSNIVKVPNTVGTDFGPDPSPDGTKIVFSRNFTGLFTIKPDGTNLVQVTNGVDDEPSWSPDGTKIAFERTTNGNGDVMVMSANGSNVVSLTNAGTDGAGEPSWSPDGTKVVYISFKGGSDEIRIINADGTNKVGTGAFNSRNPQYSPDGSKLSYHTLGGDFKIWVMNPDGSNKVQISATGNDDGFADWSPDGTKFVLQSLRAGAAGIYTMNSDGSNEVYLNVAGSNPKWR